MLSHAHIVPILGVVEGGLGDHSLAIVSPVMSPQPLRAWLRAPQFLGAYDAGTHVKRCLVLAGAAHGLSFLHARGFTHGCLSADTILVEERSVPRARLFAFGLDEASTCPADVADLAATCRATFDFDASRCECNKTVTDAAPLALLRAKRGVKLDVLGPHISGMDGRLSTTHAKMRNTATGAVGRVDLSMVSFFFGRLEANPIADDLDTALQLAAGVVHSDGGDHALGLERLAEALTAEADRADPCPASVLESNSEPPETVVPGNQEPEVVAALSGDGDTCSESGSDTVTMAVDQTKTVAGDGTVASSHDRGDVVADAADVADLSDDDATAVVAGGVARDDSGVTFDTTIASEGDTVTVANPGTTTEASPGGARVVGSSEAFVAALRAASLTIVPADDLTDLCPLGQGGFGTLSTAILRGVTVVVKVS